MPFGDTSDVFSHGADLLGFAHLKRGTDISQRLLDTIAAEDCYKIGEGTFYGLAFAEMDYSSKLVIGHLYTATLSRLLDVADSAI